MGKLTDVAIRAWIRSGERFEGRSDGDGLVLTWREKRTAPSWRLRYRFSGKPRVMEIGSYSDLTLAAARQAAKELRAKIALGHDVAGEKQERKSTALARIEAHYFQHRIGTATAGQSVYIFDQIGRRAVKRNCPQASSHRPALRHQVDRQDLPGTHLAQTDNRQQPYRPAADHRIAAPRARPGHIGAEPAGGEYIA